MNHAPPRSPLPPTEAALVGTEAGYQEMIARAWKLVPMLSARAAETEALGHVPDDIIKALVETGLMKIVRPARFGGYAQRPELMYDVAAILAHGCMSTSWVFLNLSSHDLMLAAWPIAAQHDVWDENADALISSTVVFPAGKARRVEGGYMLSGRWPFSSGVHPCGWNMLGGLVAPETEGGPPSMRFFLVPSSKYRIIDNWNVIALRGTGSNDVEMDESFIPEHHTLDYVTSIEGRAPGIADHPDELWVKFPTYTAGFLILGCMVGAARGAYEDFVKKARDARDRVSGRALAADPQYQSKIAEAGALLDMVEVFVRARWKETQDAVLAGVKFNAANGLKLRRDCAMCSKMVVQAVDILFALTGGSGLYESNAMQRVWRDIHGGAAHVIFRWDVHGTVFGKVELGLPSLMPGMSV